MSLSFEDSELRDVGVGGEEVLLHGRAVETPGAGKRVTWGVGRRPAISRTRSRRPGESRGGRKGRARERNYRWHVYA